MKATGPKDSGLIQWQCTDLLAQERIFRTLCAHWPRNLRATPSPHPSPPPRGPWGEGEPFSPRRTIHSPRLAAAQCALFPLPELPIRVRVRGNGAAYHPAYRTVPGNVEL